MKLNLKIITPRGTYFEGQVDYLSVKSVDGQLGILPRHTPLIAPLVISKLSFVKNKETNDFAISDGVLIIEKELTTVLVSTIESKKDIDLQRALDAKKRAEERLAHSDEIDINRAQASLSRALNRINVKQN